MATEIKSEYVSDPHGLRLDDFFTGVVLDGNVAEVVVVVKPGVAVRELLVSMGTECCPTGLT